MLHRQQSKKKKLKKKHKIRATFTMCDEQVNQSTSGELCMTYNRLRLVSLVSDRGRVCSLLWSTYNSWDTPQHNTAVSVGLSLGLGLIMPDILTASPMAFKSSTAVTQKPPAPYTNKPPPAHYHPNRSGVAAPGCSVWVQVSNWPTYLGW
jgi:hypothetical protein